MNANSQLSCEIDSLRSSIPSNDPSVVIPPFVGLLSSVHDRVFDKFEADYVEIRGKGRDELGREEDIVDTLIKLPMVLSNLISLLPPSVLNGSITTPSSPSVTSLRDEAKRLINESKTWLRLDVYHTAIAGHLLPLHPKVTVERFVFYNITPQLLSALLALPKVKFEGLVSSLSSLTSTTTYKQSLAPLFIAISKFLSSSTNKNKKVSTSRCKDILSSLPLTPAILSTVVLSLFTTPFTSKPPPHSTMLSSWTFISSLPAPSLPPTLAHMSRLYSSTPDCPGVGCAIVQIIHLLDDDVDEITPVISDLVTGVSLRLESSESHIRREGLVVGDALGRVMKKGVKEEGGMFEELSASEFRVYVGADADVGDDNGDDNDDGDRNDESDDESVHSEHSSSSTYSEDSEDDLLPYVRPVFIRDVIKLLQTPEQDERRREKVEGAMRDMEKVVEGKGADKDITGWTLIREVFNLSNEFDIPDFDALRSSCLECIVCGIPRIGCEYLVMEIFGEGRGMGGRWDAIDALGKGAIRLAGFDGGEEEGGNEDGGDGRVLVRVGVKSRGKRNIVKVEEGGKTRRWGKRGGGKVIDNKWRGEFGFFFSTLLSSFTASRTDTNLWSTTGSDLLLSKVLNTLTLYVDLARSNPGMDPCVKALFEAAYSFRSASNSVVTSAVLTTMMVCMGVSTPHNAIGMIESKEGGFERYVDEMEEKDVEEVRVLAKSVKGEVGSKMGEIIGLLKNG